MHVAAASTAATAAGAAAAAAAPRTDRESSGASRSEVVERAMIPLPWREGHTVMTMTLRTLAAAVAAGSISTGRAAMMI